MVSDYANLTRLLQLRVTITVEEYNMEAFRSVHGKEFAQPWQHRDVNIVTGRSHVSWDLAVNFLAFFMGTTAGASALGIAVDRGVTWYRGETPVGTHPF